MFRIQIYSHSVQRHCALDRLGTASPSWESCPFRWTVLREVRKKSPCMLSHTPRHVKKIAYYAFKPFHAWRPSTLPHALCCVRTCLNLSLEKGFLFLLAPLLFPSVTQVAVNTIYTVAASSWLPAH